jgi:hypothetical protein
MAERIAWADSDRIGRQAHRYLQGGYRDALRRLILAVPLLDGVRLAGWLARADPTGQMNDRLLDRLAATDEELVFRVAATAERDSRTSHDRIATSAQWLSFGFGDPVLTLNAYEDPGLTRISMLRDGSWSDIHLSELHHYAVTCVDADNVVVVRDEPDHGRALVYYAGGRERPVVQGSAVTGMQPAATAAGFVAGSALQPAAMAAGPDLPPGIVDLAPFGLLDACRLAVDPSGERVAFGSHEQIAVTDARLERLVARSVVPVPHGPVRGLAFTTTDEIVVSGAQGGLSRWRISPHGALVLETVGEAPRLSDLFSVPAWGVVGGHFGGEGEHRFFDPVSLAPVDPPRPFLDARYNPRLVHTVAASADGRLAAVGGYLTPDRTYSLVVHDFHHPLARVLRPVASLGESDLAEISQAAVDTARRTAEERQVLALLRDVTEDRLRGRGPEPEGELTGAPSR